MSTEHSAIGNQSLWAIEESFQSLLLIPKC
jgi:hypothetical protein